MTRHFSLVIILIISVACTRNEIKSGSELSDDQLNYIQTLGVLDANEPIIKFYSEFKFKNAGNFYTDKRMACYWVDSRNPDKNRFQSAFYNEIYSIDTVYNAGATFSPYMKIRTTDGKSFKVCAYGEKYEIKEFFEGAISKWKEKSQAFNHFTNDLMDILSEDEEIELDRILSDLKDSIGSQMVIITTSLNDEPIEEYSLRRANEIGVGRKGYNDGILITVAPNERKARIEVGYGLECIVTDSIANKILDTKMIPYFRTENYFDGLEASVIDLINRLYENQSEIGYCDSNPTYDGEKIIIE